MRLSEEQCQNVFRLDRESCRACAGYNKTCPSYSPAGKGRKIKDDAEGSNQSLGRVAEEWL